MKVAVDRLNLVKNSYYTRVITAMLWTVLLSGGLICLSGRYDWSPEMREFSVRSYLSSCYMFVMLVPCVYYFLKSLDVCSWLNRVFTGFLGILFSLPYRWLGLDQYYYNRSKPEWWDLGDPGTPTPSFDWLPKGIENLNSMPNEITFFLFLGGVGTTVALLVYVIQIRFYDRDPKLSGHKAALWLFFFCLILIQTWLHLSMRSPYSYAPSFEREPEKNFSYVVYCFPGGQGAVNRDYPVFRELESYFMGRDRIDQYSGFLLIRRSFTAYLTSNFSYFFSPYYVGLIFNILIWFAATYCGYKLTTFYYNERIPFYMAFLICCGSGFIMYVAQPMCYLPGYSCIIIVAFLFENMIVQRDSLEISQYVLFGIILGLLSMIYEIMALYPAVLLYSYLRSRSLSATILSIVIAVMVCQGFLYLQEHLIGAEMDQRHTTYLQLAWQNILKTVWDIQFGKIYLVVGTFVIDFMRNIVWAFFVVPVVLAFLGCLQIRNSLEMKLLALLGIPSVLSFAFLFFGQMEQAIFPRYVFAAYPAIYLLSAVFLGRIDSYSREIHKALLGQILVIGILAAVFVLNNIDILGYPQMYYRFFWPTGGCFR